MVRPANYLDEQIANLQGGHRSTILAADFPRELKANRWVGSRQVLLHERVELLSHSRASGLEVHAELAEVLFEERDGDMICATVGWVPRPRYFGYGKQPPGLLLLNPQDVDLYMSDLI